jgi:hypothetical protein
MEILELDPRIAGIAAAVAMLGSKRMRTWIGRGFGYAAAGVISVGSPVVNAGRDIVDEAREVATHNGSTETKPSRARSAAAA